MEKILVVSNLSKKYDEIVAVNNISFEVKAGSLFAFLGENGAGKSTTINIICSIIKKDEGKIFVNGLDLDTSSSQIKNLLGVVFQNSVLDERLSVIDNLKTRLSFYKIEKEEKKQNLDKIIKLLELEPILYRPLNKLSGGQKRRIDIARSIIHYPKFLILDEPTTGLDPQTRKTVWSILDKIRKETGMSIFLTTHYLEEADYASDVVIMDKGIIKSFGTPNELKNKYSNDYLVIYKKEDKKFETLLNKKKVAYNYNSELNVYNLKYKNINEIKKALNDYQDYLDDFEIRKGNMDDVFLNITGRNKKDE